MRYFGSIVGRSRSRLRCGFVAGARGRGGGGGRGSQRAAVGGLVVLRRCALVVDSAVGARLVGTVVEASRAQTLIVRSYSVA